MKRAARVGSPWAKGILCALIALLLAGCARDDVYPSGPITMIVPWGVGGGTDRVARQMARFLEVELKVPVNVVNATGGRGVTGHSRGLRARPDGYTLTMMTLELNMLHWQDLTRISWREGRPLMSVNEDAAAFFVRSDSPWKSLADLRAAVEQAPGTLTASGTASGGAWHLATTVWLDSFGRKASDVKWIPMNGSAASLQEMLSGGLDFVCCSLPEAKTQLSSQQARSLGVMSDERAPGFDDVPTFKEQGFEGTLIGWRGFAVPRDTPEDRVERLASAMERIVRRETLIDGKSFPEYLESQGFNARWRKTDDFARFLEENDAAFGRIYSRAGMASGSRGRVGPWTFPRLLAGCLVGLLLCLAIGRWRNRRQQRAASPGEEAAPGPVRISWNGLIPSAVVLLVVVAYIAFAETAGFLLVMGAGLFATLLSLRNSLVTSVLVAVLATPAVYHVFSHFLSVPLPRGGMGW